MTVQAPEGTPAAAKAAAAANQGNLPAGVELLGEVRLEWEGILSKDALEFVATLARKYSGRVTELLERRREVQAKYDAGKKPRFLEETKHVREGDWQIAPLPADFQDRRVINALNSGANVYMPDFEDSNCPTWDNMVGGQLNLHDAVRRTISYKDPASGKDYALREGELAVMVCRPRGWHLWEHHMLVDGGAVPGAIFDFGLYFFHNARELLARGSGPYFYLPKMQARAGILVRQDKLREVKDGHDGTWVAHPALIPIARAVFDEHMSGPNQISRQRDDVVADAEALLAVPSGPRTFGALRNNLNVCILYMAAWIGGTGCVPLAQPHGGRRHRGDQPRAGLNCGRWDYMFSFIKTMRSDPTRVMPDRGYLTMEMPFLRAYTQARFLPLLRPPTRAPLCRALRGLPSTRESLVVKTCHKRGAFAMGGMSAAIPIKGDEAANNAVMEKVWQWVQYGAKLDDGQTVTQELVRNDIIIAMGK
eukprot:scaffold9.g3215.t1